jgi:hypothetical protein
MSALNTLELNDDQSILSVGPSYRFVPPSRLQTNAANGNK